ncbi:tetraspanin-4 isoform X5 [Silurus meridionalis]|nr:tetraspanin-4 isoform X5 [Silurus meridionalis]
MWATACILGVTTDNELSFFPHVAKVARSCRSLLYNIRRIRPFLSTQAAQMLVQSLVISKLDYYNFLLAGLPLNAIRPLQMIQNAAARLVFNQPKISHTTPLLRSLHWLPVAACIRFKTLMLAYKAKNGPAPSYLSDLITSRTAPRCLRSSSTARLVPPSLKMNGSFEQAFVFCQKNTVPCYLPCYERVKSWLQENLVALWIFALCTALTQVFTPALYGLCNNDVMMVLWFDTGLQEVFKLHSKYSQPRVVETSVIAIFVGVRYTCGEVIAKDQVYGVYKMAHGN